MGAIAWPQTAHETPDACASAAVMRRDVPLTAASR